MAATSEETNSSALATSSALSKAPKKIAKSAKTSSKKAAGRKKGAPVGAARKATAKRKASTPAVPQPSDADVRLRAYFIAERRVQLALQGDPGMDWIEARAQLLAEAKQERA